MSKRTGARKAQPQDDAHVVQRTPNASAAPTGPTRQRQEPRAAPSANAGSNTTARGSGLDIGRTPRSTEPGRASVRDHRGAASSIGMPSPGTRLATQSASVHRPKPALLRAAERLGSQPSARSSAAQRQTCTCIIRDTIGSSMSSRPADGTMKNSTTGGPWSSSLAVAGSGPAPRGTRQGRHEEVAALAVASGAPLFDPKT